MIPFSSRSDCDARAGGRGRQVYRGVCVGLLMLCPLVWGIAAGTLAAQEASADPVDVLEVHDVVVDFARQIDVPARRSGTVAALTVRQNDTVQAGQVLAKLDETSLMIRRRSALLQLESARLVLADDLELKFARTALEEAEAELGDSRSVHDTVRGAVPLNQLRRMRLAVQRGELEVARVEKQRRQAEIDQQLRVADLAVIDDELSRLESLSPIDGVALAVHREIGEWVQAGEPLLTVATVGRLRLHAMVDAKLIDTANCVGLPVTVRWDTIGKTRGGSLRGQVVSVDPGRLPGNRVRLHAEVTNRRQIRSTPNGAEAGSWMLLPGMEVTLRIDQSPAQVALRVAPPRDRETDTEGLLSPRWRPGGVPAIGSDAKSGRLR